MTTAKNPGIWMDHSTAHLMEFTTHPIETKVLASAFTHGVREQIAAVAVLSTAIGKQKFLFQTVSFCKVLNLIKWKKQKTYPR